MTNDELYRSQAKVVYENMVTMQRESLRLQTDLAKWLLSSLLVLHTAALAAVLYKGAAQVPTCSILCFTAGVVAAFAAGFATWLNAGAVTDRYEEHADYRMLTDVKYWPKSGASPFIDATRFAAIAFGFASIGLWVAGALLLR